MRMSGHCVSERELAETSGWVQAASISAPAADEGLRSLPSRGLPWGAQRRLGLYAVRWCLARCSMLASSVQHGFDETL